VSSLPEVGAELPPWDVPAVSGEKMKTMAALLHDSNPIHFDIPSVQALGLGDRPVNQGPSNMAYVMNMLAAWAGGTDRVRSLRVRFLGNVLADQHLRASGVVTAVRHEEGGPVAECDVLLSIVGGDPVLSGTATVLLNDPGAGA